MAAQDAELKLKVSLDLGFFRQQLAGLGQAAAGYNLPVRVQFDRRSVQNELNALGANIRRRNYRLTVETNLSAEIAKADTLARKLGELSGKLKATRGGGGVAQGREAISQIEEVLRGGLSGRAFGIQKAQENIAKQAILSRLEKASLSKGGYNTAGLEKIIRDLGGTPTGGRKDLVAQAKKLVEESNGIADAVFDNLKDLQMKLRPIRGQAQTSAARSMPNLNQMLDRIANLTENPRAAQRMLRMMPESRLTTDLVGAANRQAAFREQYGPQGFRLPGFGGAKAFDPLLKAIAKDFSDYTKTVNITDPWVGQIGDGIRRIVAVSAQAATATTKALPPVGGTTSPMSALERRLAQSRGALGTGGAAAGSLFTGRGLVNPGVSMLSPVGISGNYRQMAAALANQAANPALAHRQIADIGFGGVPTAATGMSGEALNRALNQAFLQRRGLGIGGGQPLPVFNAPGVAVQQNIPGMAYRMGGGGLGGSMGMFPSAGMMGPSSPLTINARSSMFGGGGAMPPRGGGSGAGGMGGMGGFGRALGGVNLPGAGAIRELGQEFAFATQQVLLFGQAYKMLAFIQNFPAQVGAAVSQLQNFRNTLGAISPSAEEAAASNRLILDLVDKYNVPLQSARDGFTKLYASMAPAGFSGDEIRDLFTGITQAAATFGMSADKVDRVNYAFAQMASKGQVMSEELKGQLGDVLPGAMAIFAEAAGFKGPKAIQDFSAALEDGAYKGQAMVALLKNVGVVMNQEFGPGAEGAARTFQGVINRMQNSMTLLYESFEPVAVGFLNTVVVPLTDGIKQISDGFNAFFTGTAAQTAGGFGIAQELERLRPAFDGIRANLAGLVDQFGQFARVALDVGKVLLQIAGNPIVGYLARLYAIALPINIALNVMRGLWAANALQLLIFNARVATGTSTLSAFRGMMAATGATAQTTAASIRTAGITLRTFFAATGVGLVVVGISMLIEKFMSMNQALADTKAKALGAAQAIRSMSQTEARVAEQQAQSAYQLIGQISGRAGAQQPGGDRLVPVSQKELSQLQQLGAIRSQQTPGGPLYVKRSEAMALAPQAQRLQSEAAFRQRQIKFEEQQTQQQAVLAPIPPSEKEEKKKKEKELDVYNRSQLDFIKQRFDAEKQILDQQLQSNLLSQTSYDIKLAELTLETERAELQERFRLESEKIKADNLSAADKALALKDQEVKLANGLAIAEKQRDIAVKGARLQLEKPFIDALRNENLEIEKQETLLNNLKNGVNELTAEQQANFIIEEKLAGLKADEQKLIESRINGLREQIRARIENLKLIEKEQGLFEAQRGLGIIGGGLRAGFTGSAAGVFERAMEQYGDTDYATQLANIETSAMQLRSVFEGLQGAIAGVSGAFANMLTEGITNMITGTASAKEVFASFLQSVGQALSQAASQMIATYIAIGIAKMFAGLSGGSAGGVDYGSGKVATNAFQSTDALGLSNSISGGGAAFGASAGTFSNASFGIGAFANGGVVSGPTLSLIGEGKYNEAVVPLPNGKSIPVQFSGERSARDMMSRNAQAVAQASPINLSFETTKIGNTEYVSRDQLEAAMAETRRAAINGGAARGMSMTLDRIQQSPSVRSRIGIR